MRSPVIHETGKYSLRGILRSKKRLCAAPVDIHALRLFWAITILWYEYGTFFWSVSGCHWPDKGLKTHGDITHVLLIADPQILDNQSYPGRSRWLMRLTQFIVDLNMRKSWNVAKRFHADALVFLGDMMDNGRFAFGDNEYERYVQRFKTMFTLDPPVPTYYIPGNHDVGMGNSRKFSPRARQRYAQHFGPVNQRISIGNHTFVMIDAPGLVEEDYLRAKAGLEFQYWRPPRHSTVQFIKNFANEGSDGPVVLLSHIPLHRPDSASCGPLRERGSIRRGVGYGYQNTLGKLTSEFILQSLGPRLIFSGDDHDYCEYVHNIPLSQERSGHPEQVATEITVKSFSMAMGIKHPGFQLLSLVNPSPNLNETFAHTPCILPDQIGIYVHRYIPLFVLTILFLFVANILPRFRRQDVDSISKHSRGFSKYLNSLRLEALTGAPPDLSLRSPISPRTPRLATLSTPTLRPASTTQLALSPNSPSLRSSFRAAGDGGNMLLDTYNHDDGYYSGDDSIDPAQFATRRPLQPDVTGSPQILPLPGITGRNKYAKRGTKEQRWDWSGIFVIRWLGGINLIHSLRNISSAFLTAGRESGLFVRRGSGSRNSVRGLLTLLLLDVLAVAWCPIVIYLFIVYRMYL